MPDMVRMEERIHEKSLPIYFTMALYQSLHRIDIFLTSSTRLVYNALTTVIANF